MSKNRNRVAGVSGLVVLAFLAISIGQASAAVIWDGISPLPNDSTSWAGLGADQTLLGKTFSATSTAGNSISGSFAGNHGLVAVVGTSWPAGPGFNSGDRLVWAFDNSVSVNAGSGPLTLGFGTAVLAGGVEIQSDAAGITDAAGIFTAQVQAFNGATSLGTFALASDAAGDPIFLGARDTVADITSLAFVLTTCRGAPCDINDFAVDTLRSINPATSSAPEPGTLALLGTSLLGLAALRHRRRT
ncbi:MAG TPA: PEP-CTERM sorting domain-containing protein [Stellaceae bacterium]|jgi:hypothetical protein|nr:PEP-CTERM sorting domain-containing protein [Stellaceae bacterium]